MLTTVYRISSHRLYGIERNLLPEFMHVGLFLGCVNAVRQRATSRIALQAEPNVLFAGIDLGMRGERNMSPKKNSDFQDINAWRYQCLED